MRLYRRVMRPQIHSRTDRIRYVVEVTIACLAVALAIDIVNQLAFFITWDRVIRSWIVTTVIVTIVAVPVAHAIASANLDLYEAKVKLETLSRTDPLTGLLNRRALFETGEAPAPKVVALVIVDIDRFKRVNDTHGHIAGDAVLATVAHAMVARFADCSTVARLGGEEFALLASKIPAEELLERLWAFRDHIASLPILVGGVSVSVTISAGVAHWREGTTFAQLYAEADRALYLAKASGRNRVVVAGEQVMSLLPSTNGWVPLAPVGASDNLQRGEVA